MNGERRLSLDTNILVYAMDRDAGAKRDLAIQIVDRAVDCDTVLTLQVLSEFFAATTRKGKMPPEEARAQVMDWLTLFPLVAAKPTTWPKAMRGVLDHGFSFWDAMLCATAQEAGVNLLISEDFQHDRVLEGLRFCNPFVLEGPIQELFTPPADEHAPGNEV